MTERVPLLTPAELAALLAVPESTLADWRYRRSGPRYLRLGRLVRYSLEEVDEWLAAGSVGCVEE